jgi:hypothetical protein
MIQDLERFLHPLERVIKRAAELRFVGHGFGKFELGHSALQESRIGKSRSSRQSRFHWLLF